MQVITTAAAMQAEALRQRAAGKRIGLVPTMGFLHEGHLSLVREARRRAEWVVLSLFVNPTQFGPNEDLSRYPRDEARDLALCEAEGVDAVFMPPADSMYAPDASVWVDETRLSAGLCGASRPGHFRGVCTVVSKLFNLVLPQVAVFGEKDFQQLAVIRRMVRDLDFPIEIVAGAIVREPDGLARSSRNVYLDADERRRALGLSAAIELARVQAAAGERRCAVLRAAIETLLVSTYGLRVDYIALVDGDSLEPLEVATDRTRVVLAVFCGRTRLIDNGALF